MEGLEAIRAQVVTLQDKYFVLQRALEEVVQKKQQTKATATKQANDARRVRNRACAAYKHAPVQLLVRYLFDRQALIQEKEASAPGSAADTVLKQKWPVVPADKDSFDAAKPALLKMEGDDAKSAERSVGQTVRELISAIGKERLDNTLHEVCHEASANSQTTGKAMFKAQGQPTDTIEAQNWVPARFKAQNATPESLRSFGCPALLFCQTGHAVSDHKEWILPGVGKFILGFKGSVTLFTWPASSVRDLGGTVEK